MNALEYIELPYYSVCLDDMFQPPSTTELFKYKLGYETFYDLEKNYQRVHPEWVRIFLYDALYEANPYINSNAEFDTLLDLENDGYISILVIVKLWIFAENNQEIRNWLESVNFFPILAYYKGVPDETVV